MHSDTLICDVEGGTVFRWSAPIDASPELMLMKQAMKQAMLPAMATVQAMMLPPCSTN